MSFEWGDLLTILVLVLLEGLLSGDNALVLAVVVLPLPEDQQRKALRYGLLGAFVLRVIATFLAVWLAQMRWVSLVGGAYLLYLPFKHFTQHPDEEPAHGSAAGGTAGRILGLSLFWSIVIKADLIDLVFAVDSILAAVGITKKTWVIIAGGLLGILMMRLLTLQVLELVKRYPKLIDGAYVVIAWVGIKLVWEWLHAHHLVPFEIPQVVGIGVVIALFVGSFLYARAHAQSLEPHDAALVATAEDCESLLEDEPDSDEEDEVPADAGESVRVTG